MGGSRACGEGRGGDICHGHDQGCLNKDNNYCYIVLLSVDYMSILVVSIVALSLVHKAPR